MLSTEDPKLPGNTARRHFLGVAAAAGARFASVAAIAMAVSSSPAHAMGRRWGRGGSGGRGHGNSGGSGNGNSGGGGGAHCFLRGTSILTDCGEKRVEDLRIGDRVALPDGDIRRIKWVGRQVFKRSGARWHDGVVPVRVSRHALDEHTPHSDLYLSPGHALLLNGVLIRVKDLVNGTTIAPVVPANDRSIEYYAVLLDTHEVILAEGAAAETFHPSDNSHENFSNFAEYERLYAGEERGPMTSYAPVVGEEGGWTHLKALLLLGASHWVPTRHPFEDACEKINARAKELSV
ncbi:Hint domain-containing protein (plasmid) [Rhizobium sp. T1470]|uniref:Hedgehog/Intein (Hint) domain-containing protein n=3 Tax=Rhizobium favelukesii TaxID=348824 RepID=W6RPM9_9HYPH|nr:MULTISPECIES: Hint domain-containing protein [Rhizobium]MCA0803235.1 Hint domain-containing protein [Rhizobium sp. T1473]MCA0805470.1 Hint domain-containing protein [Rhizobium sp. T1473]MCS0463818.1 Hint domain-containing protein [Rhizobium favelukesii]UFS79202.1 Hint domain-containing protein [Rhizobium sp. T136]UFS83227.1 Hint domain-containing protein [Rhizobium sp. T136]